MKTQLVVQVEEIESISTVEYNDLVHFVRDKILEINTEKDLDGQMTVDVIESKLMFE